MKNFKKVNDWAFKKMCVESESVSKSVCQEWKSELHNLVNDYDPNDAFNVDKTGPCFKCLSDKKLTFENKKCHERKPARNDLRFCFV